MKEADPRGDRDIIIDPFNGKVILGAAGGRRPSRPFVPTNLFAERDNNLQLEPKPVYRRSDALDRRRSSLITRRLITCKSVDQCDHLHSAAPRHELRLT